MAEEFLWAVKNGDLVSVQAFKEAQNVDVVNTEINGRYPLHVAADYGQIDVIKFLLDKGAKINQADKHGLTPLLSAIFEGHTECVKMLLERGADKTLKSPDGKPYIECAENDDIKALLK
ncbi:myotrophin-like [Babylonia areolata]|uniref:myotrophin-like n=1 Tax=Babylonia areolata TaxID=304850 RepID=UPI003FD0AF94